MANSSYTKADVELFVDLDRATAALGTTPCLIGAGAIRLGADFNWGVRLDRITEDWDFVVRMESREQFAELTKLLVAESGGFNRSKLEHRFNHRGGGTLDIIPYGPLEDPSGEIQWNDGSRMNTSGLSVLDEHHEKREIENVALRSATLPALVGLKLLAYHDRRPGITRDIGDVQVILRDIEDAVDDERVSAECLDRFSSGDVTYGEAGAYLLGRDVGRTFDNRDREVMVALLENVGQPEDPTLGHALGYSFSEFDEQKSELSRLPAFRLGLIDG